MPFCAGKKERKALHSVRKNSAEIVKIGLDKLAQTMYYIKAVCDS